MILYIENTKRSFHQETTRTDKCIHQSSRIQNFQKSVSFLCANNELTEKKIKKTIPFRITLKRIKYLGINLTKELKNLYSENYKTEERN